MLWRGDGETLAQLTSRRFSDLFIPDESIPHPPFHFEKEYIARRIAAQYEARTEEFQRSMDRAHPGGVRRALASIAVENGEHLYTLVYGVPQHVAQALRVNSLSALMFVCQLGDMDPDILTALRERATSSPRGYLAAGVMTDGAYSSVPSTYDARQRLCTRVVGTAMAYPLLRAGVPMEYLSTHISTHISTLAACMLIGVPVEYAAAGARLGLDPDSIDRYYREGIPLEYLAGLVLMEE